MSRVPPTLWRQLSTTLPTARQTLFLRACLADGDHARGAFREWTRYAGPDNEPIARDQAALAPFLPLLWWSASRNGFQMEPRLVTSLRCAHVTEDVRWQAYRRICRSAFDDLRKADVPFVALKGAALSETVYPTPLVRHTGDIDVLVASRDLDRAAAALLARGWRWPSPSPSREGQQSHLPPLFHDCGLPLELHDRLLIPHYTLPYQEFWMRSRTATLMGIDARVLSPADTLVHVISHGVTDAMTSVPCLRWVPDAWFLLQRHPDLDWSVFVADVTRARLGLPVLVALRYLANEMDARVPPAVIEEIDRMAAESGFLDRAAARLYARPWSAGTARGIWSGPGTAGERLVRLWRRAFPPPVEAALRFDLRPWQVPFFYVSRFSGFARRWASARSGQASPKLARRSPITAGVADTSRPRSSQ